MDIARVFISGNSQAVRLPKRYRLHTDAVFIRKDAATGDLVLSSRPTQGSWAEFFALRARTKIPSDFLVDRPLNVVESVRDPFAAQVAAPRKRAKR